MAARTPEAEPLLTPAEVATMFRVDPKTVTRWAKAGKLTSIRTLGGHRRYRETEVRALLDPFREHLFQAGIGQISEIFEGDPPHAPRGCIAQAWSVAQLFDIAQACEV